MQERCFTKLVPDDESGRERSCKSAASLNSSLMSVTLPGSVVGRLCMLLLAIPTNYSLSRLGKFISSSSFRISKPMPSY